MLKQRFCLWIAPLALTAVWQTMEHPLHAAPAKAQQPHPAVQALLDQSDAASNAGKSTDTLRLANQALTKARALADKIGQAGALDSIGDIYYEAGQHTQALKFYNQALPLWRAGRVRQREATTLNSIGDAHYSLGQYSQSLKFYNQAWPLFKTLGDKAGQARALLYVGHSHYGSAQYPQALKFFNQSQPLFKALGDKAGLAGVLNEIAGTYYEMGNYAQSLKFYTSAQPIFKALGDKAGEAGALHSMGRVSDDMGQRRQALKYYNMALPLRRAARDRDGEATTLNNIGSVNSSLGQPSQALSFYNQSLALRRAMKDKAGEALALHNAGHLYHASGQRQQAMKVYSEARPLYAAVGDKVEEAVMLDHIGALHYEMDQPQEALKFHSQALPLFKAAQDAARESSTLSQIGHVHFSSGQLQEALSFYNRARTRFQTQYDQANEAKTLNNLGEVYAAMGQAPQALKVFALALPLLREVGDTAGQARRLSNLAALAESQGRLAEAETHLRAALQLSERSGASAGGPDEARVSFPESNLLPYYRTIDLLLKMSRPAEAFAWAEKARARALRDLMAHGMVEINSSATAAELKRERQLQQEVIQADSDMGLQQRLLDEAAAEKMDTDSHRQALTAAQKQLAQAERAAQTFADNLYTKYPDLAPRRAGRAVTLDTLAQLLPADAALLEYVTLTARGLDKTVLFCATLENGKAVVTTFPIAKPRRELVKLVEDFRGVCADPRQDAKSQDYRSKARDLSALLIAPAAQQLSGKKRLLICPDASLWGLPFQALPAIADGSAAPDGDQLGGPLLIERFEIAYASSATAAHAAAQLSALKKAPPAKTLLALANPQYDAAPAAPTSIMTAAREVFTGRTSPLPPLPRAQSEADALKDEFPDAAVYSGAQAQEATAKRDAAQFRYLHFGASSPFNASAPLLSSIALALPAPGSTEDGFLSAREIFDLKWNADLAVLSACDTGRGGEGVVGLTWALCVAGAPAQVVTQWPMDDAGTAQLMKQFFANLKQGQLKGAALRAATLALLKDGQHGHPYYWAPFILIGDGRS